MFVCWLGYLIDSNDGVENKFYYLQMVYFRKSLVAISK